MIQQPTLETPRLILSPYRDDDIADVFAYAGDDDVARYVAWPAHKTLEDSRSFLEWIKSTTCSDPRRPFFVFAIHLKTSGRVIGSIDFKNGGHSLSGQIDYAMGKAHWGQGLMTEAASALRDWAFETFPEIVRLQSFCHSENVGSSRVMEKIGMQFEGLRRKALLIKGEPIDIVSYALIRERPRPSPGL